MLSRIRRFSAMSVLALLVAPVAGFSAAAEEALVPAAAIAGAETVQVDGDIYRYRAILAETEEGADLYIFTDAGEGWKQAVHARDIVWRGGMYGQEPWLEAQEHGSLKIISENSAIGRNRWEQVLTIAYRGGEFRVAGYTYSYYDTLDPDANGQCDVNLLTGKGELNGKSFKTALGAMPAQNWTMDTRPPECSVE